MKTAGIVIDSWKLAIFRKVLDGAEFIYTEGDGPTKDTLVLRVAYDDKELSVLTSVVRIAEVACQDFKDKQLH